MFDNSDNSDTSPGMVFGWGEQVFGEMFFIISVDFYSIISYNKDIPIRELIQMEKCKEIKEVKAEIKKAIKWADNYSLTVKVYDCDESGEQTYDVEVSLYVGGEYKDTWVTDVGYQNEYEDSMKRARAVRTAMMRDFDEIPKVESYTM